MFTQAGYVGKSKLDFPEFGVARGTPWRSVEGTGREQGPELGAASEPRCRGRAGGAACGVLQTKRAGEMLFSQGDRADGAYEVVRGMLRLYKMLPDGRRQITGFVSTGELVGVTPNGARPYTAEAVTDLVLCRFPPAAFDRMIDEQPGFARRLLSATADDLDAAQEQMLLLGRMTAVEKVVSFLLVLAKRQGGVLARFVDLPMGRNDIADYLGLTIETVSRTLSRLKQAGSIGLPTPTRVEIRDIRRLEMLAHDGAAAAA
ncbi:MAG: helix-turn-helix domain-containing protein [Rhodospirillales bacterium]|nr:helix-turn-helix domain-containing protein [Rhodospirillales bacterium]